ncbi:MAG: precorrin-6y C5,15-methyltransferase (decarboxylating) subunit CbiE [Alicyclobacillus sp.]|nr:precorrin-6y C5,15-methyltransferase (decarboxylating) subunit CbiE [Alicyclobacillus sp.]
MEKWVSVVGIGDDGARGLSARALERVAQAEVLAGGERQLAFFPEFSGERVLVKAPLSAVVSALLRHRGRRVVVLASGDPLFYGIGSYLARKLGPDAVEVLPSLSSVQLAFARCGESWEEARIISLHGRPITGLAQRLHGARKAALLTDDVNTPGAVATYLLHFGFHEYEAFVAENLGGDDERCAWYALEDLPQQTFSPLNVVVLRLRTGVPAPLRWPLGIDDREFYQRKPDRGLITKKEVRVLSLAELALPAEGVLWDIGACTGSVAIEAILQNPGLRVYAIEKNAEDLENLRQNQIKFRADFVAVQGRAPARLDEFPDPDAVFIGGSGGELPELLHLCAKRLQPGGRMVVNAATIETLAGAHQTLRGLGFDTSVTLLQTARSKPILNLTRFEGMNPVYLVTAWRPQDLAEEGDARDE